MNTTLNSSTTSPTELPLLAQIGLLAGPFLSMLDANIVNVALPAIAQELHTSLDTVQWIVSGYLLALAATLAASAYLAKRFGTTQVYLVSLLGFTLASTFCALSPSIGFLIAARALQGALGAPLVPLAMTLLLGKKGVGRQLPPAAGIVLFLAPALGPTIGGILIHLAGWPLIFLINLPFGLLGCLGVLHIRQRPVVGSTPTVRFDAFGILALAAGLVLAIYGAMQASQLGWSSQPALPLLVSGVALLLLYGIWALRIDHPAVDLKLLRHPQTALAIGLCALVSVVLFVMLFLLPVFLEDIQGYSPLVAGLTLLPQGLTTGIGNIFGNRVSVRVGLRSCTLLGMAILVVSTAALLLVSAATPAWITALILSGRGLALGLTIQPLLNAMLQDLSPEEIPDGNTLFNVMQRLGGSIGIPLLATFFALRESTRVAQVLQAFGLPAGSIKQAAASTTLTALPQALKERLLSAAVSGFHDTIWLLVLLSLLGFGASWLLHDQHT